MDRLPPLEKGDGEICETHPVHKRCATVDCLENFDLDLLLFAAAAWICDQYFLDGSVTADDADCPLPVPDCCFVVGISFAENLSLIPHPEQLSKFWFRDHIWRFFS